LGQTWETLGTYLEYIWDIFGIKFEQNWDKFGKIYLNLDKKN